MEQGDGKGDDGPPTADSTQSGPRRTTFTPPSADAYEQFSASGMDSTPIPVDAPPPNPATVVTPPPGSGFPRPPERRSLDDDILVSTLDQQGLRDGGVLDAIEQLQAQLRIREEEAREFRSWESSMLAIGTPEALDVVEETRVTFTGAIQIIPLPTAASPQDAAPQQAMAESQAIPQPQASAQPDESDGDDDGDSITDVSPPVAPLESPRTEPGQIIIVPEDVTVAQAVFVPETSGAEPTLPELRAGHAFRLFWLWFAANSSVLSIVFGGILLSLGMSLRQSIVAALAGVALSFLPIGLGTLASKWNGQPTMVVSRASFGLVGNVVPGIIALVTRVLWGGVLLWLFASVTAGLLVAADAGGGLSVLQLTILSGGIAFLISLVVAFFGHGLLARVQLVLSVASAALVIVLVVVSWHLVDLAAALTIGDGPWVLVLAGAILVFSFVGLVWSTSAGDLARYQRPAGAGAGSMLTASFGNTVPAFVLIAYGALLAASNPVLASGFMKNPVETLTTLVPEWFLLPLIAAVGIGLLSSIILSIYSGGFALIAVVPLRRELAVLAIGVLLGGLALALALTAADITGIFRDLATTLAVPTAAWLGIFTAEIMIRNRRFDTRSLVQRGGIYPDFHWANLALLAIATAAGYGFTTASVGWLSWQGYLLQVVGVPAASDLAQADFGVLVALATALVTTIAFGVSTIRRQEALRG